jgi:type 1 glutamine amidotransferase
MKVPARAWLAALVAALATVPLAAAEADRGGGHARHFRALVFTKTAEFRHTECIPEGRAAIGRMARRRDFDVAATEDAGAFTAANLARYDVVVFLCTTGDVLDDAQQAAFARYIRRGGGYAGIHAASDTEYDWPFYGGLVGARFRDHTGSVNAQFQTAAVNVEDRRSAATKRLPKRWTREEEWYNFRSDPRDSVHVLASVDESTYDARGYSQPGGSPPMGDHPIAWCRRYEGGRSFYTAMGHKGAYWKERLFLSHVRGGIRMAAGAAPFRCG